MYNRNAFHFPDLTTLFLVTLFFFGQTRFQDGARNPKRQRFWNNRFPPCEVLQGSVHPVYLSR